MKKNDILQTIAQPDFRKLWLSQILSQLSINLVNFIIIMRIFESTGSTVAVSLVWIFYALPAVLLGPFSGTIIDLFRRKNILVWTTLLEAIIILNYIFLGSKIWPVYTIIFLYSLVSQLYVPAEAATLPETVKKELLPSANSLFLITLYGSFVVGSSMAGPLVRFGGSQLPIFLSAAALLSASYSVSRLPDFGKTNSGKVSNLQDFFNRVREGYIFIKDQPLVLYPILLMTLSQVILSVMIILAPSFATEVIKIRLLDAGVFLILPAAAGIIFGLAVFFSLIKHLRKIKIITFGLFLSSFALLSLGTVLPRILFGRILIGIICVFLLGASFVNLIIPSQTLIQEMTPEDLRGRVFGVLSFMIIFASLLPVLLTATLADFFGVGWIISFTGVIILCLAIFSWRRAHAVYTNHRS